MKYSKLLVIYVPFNLYPLEDKSRDAFHMYELKLLISQIDKILDSDEISGSVITTVLGFMNLSEKLEDRHFDITFFFSSATETGLRLGSNEILNVNLFANIFWLKYKSCFSKQVIVFNSSELKCELQKLFYFRKTFCSKIYAPRNKSNSYIDQLLPYLLSLKKGELSNIQCPNDIIEINTPSIRNQI